MILNIYKQKGWTSFDVVKTVRGILRAKRNTKKVKVGHAGTLDPLAEGVLVVLTDDDTKKQNEYMNATKEYSAQIAFGAVSETYDLEGELKVSIDIDLFSEMKEKLPEVLKKFVGEIQQRVPAYSAVKVDGQRLYKKARKGEIKKEDLPVKTVFVHRVTIKSFSLEYIPDKNGEVYHLPLLNCVIECSKGTYIRSLAHDIGEAMGVGAVLVNLVRTRVGAHVIAASISLEQFEALQVTGNKNGN